MFRHSFKFFSLLNNNSCVFVLHLALCEGAFKKLLGFDQTPHVNLRKSGDSESLPNMVLVFQLLYPAIFFYPDIQ